ncbi:MAG: glycosyl transferase [Elusimicrobia bacterium HGW-Elusimicrobia-2]|nr:MAG: glycosyl transferase [Elusimicrobia bacterium HGW-Elusimicrobia-2]
MNKMEIKQAEHSDDSFKKQKYRYYHKNIEHLIKQAVPEGSRVLDIKCDRGDLLASLAPSRGVGIDRRPESIEGAKSKYPNSCLEFMCLDIETEKFLEGRVFDYIILNDALGEIADIQLLLRKIHRYCERGTRLIVIQYNPLWERILKMAEKLNLKMPEKIDNWLSIDDLENFFTITRFQFIKRDFRLLFPLYFPIFSFLANRYLAKLPVVRRLNLIQMIVARPWVQSDDLTGQSVSVVITCRDEKENIEPLVQRIPMLGSHTEIIFVEGHSADATRGEIKRIISKYPEKDIRLLIQDRVGQKDAIIKGFDLAKGDFIILLEADLTTPPEEISKLWDAYRIGSGEYINGTRLVYSMAKGSMPYINLMGNRVFGNIFTGILSQRFTDVLCGLKAVSKKDYLKIKRSMPLWGDFDPFGDFDIIFGAVINNLKVVEVPVKYYPRKYGETKTRPFKHGWLLFRACCLGFKKFVLD